MFASAALDHRCSDEGVAMRQKRLRVSGAYTEFVLVAEGSQCGLDESVHAAWCVGKGFVGFLCIGDQPQSYDASAVAEFFGDGRASK